MRIAALPFTLLLSSPAWGQHVHVVPHSTTHTDIVRHGNHYHAVPHTTTHLDVVTHPNTLYVQPQVISQPAPVYVQPAPQVVVQPSPVYTQPAPVYQQPTPQPTPVYSQPEAVAVAPAAPQAGVQQATYQTVSLKPNVLPPYSGPGVAIVLPAATGGNLTYVLDGATVQEIAAGNRHTARSKAKFIIEFDRGGNFGTAKYELKEGVYEFIVGEKGWDIVLTKEDPNAAPPTTPIKRNSLPPTASPAAPQPAPGS